MARTKPILPSDFGWSALCGKRILRAISMDVTHPGDSSASGCMLEIDDCVVFAFEDPSDGYRSCCNEPLIGKTSSAGYRADNVTNLGDVPVLIELWEFCEPNEDRGGQCTGIRVKDTRNGATILLLGTNNIDDYYPSYTCDWQPQNLAVSRHA